MATAYRTTRRSPTPTQSCGSDTRAQQRGSHNDQYGNPRSTDTRFRLQGFDANGGLIASWQLSFGGAFTSRAAMAVDQHGHVYLAVAEAHRVWKFSSDGDLVTSWGNEGAAAGEFSRPEGIAVGPDDHAYVTDSGNHRVQKFTSGGAYVTEWGSQGTGEGEFERPFGVAADQEGSVYVTELEGHRVQKFTAEGTFVTRWGSAGDREGEFSLPAGVAVDQQGQVHVLDAGNHRIQAFVYSEGWTIYLPFVTKCAR